MASFGTLSPADQAEADAADPILRNIPVVLNHLAKSAWTLPERAIGAAAVPAGLRREDVTDIPGDAQPSDDLTGAGLETALGLYGTSAPFIKPGMLGAAGGRMTTPADRPAMAPGTPPDWFAAATGATPDVRPGAPGATPAIAAEPASVSGAVAGGSAGSGGRAVGLEEAQAAAARWAGARSPLEGLPSKPVIIGGEHFVPGPIGSVADIAEQYMKSTGRAYQPPSKYHPVDPEHSKAIAQAFEEMKHAPDDPAVQNSYRALIDETKAQYDAMTKSGLKVEPILPGMPDPYAANPRLAARDVAENNHLWFFPTEGGFGSGAAAEATHPMLQSTGVKLGDRDLLANDMFRVVHDYFGHLKEGHGFRAAGEDNAWRAHASMYSDIARPAMTTETRGQNSWVNYGPHGETNRTAKAADTVYADQKVGLLPNWTMYDPGQAPMVAHHGTPHQFDQFSLDKIGTGEGNQVYGHGLYFAENPDVAMAYRHQLAMSQDPLTKKYGIADQAHTLGKHLAAQGGDVERLIADYRSKIPELERGDKSDRNLAADYTARIKYLNDPKRSRGHQYDVAIEADPAQFLDWDTAMREQSPYVRERVMPVVEAARQRQEAALAQRAERERDPSPFSRSAFQSTRRGAPSIIIPDEVKGSKAYQMAGLPAVNQTEGMLQATAALRKAGIPGLRYLDQGSRGQSGSTSSRNLVLFDDSIVKILKRYGIAGMLGGGSVLDQALNREAK